MKTSVNMLRKMGKYNVSQRTKDGMFNATDLIKQWNKSNDLGKRIKDFIKLSQTEEFVDELKTELESQRDFSPNAEYQVVITIKGRNTKKGKTPNVVWYHPYLFIKFAMWLNPRFELQVIKFIADQLIENRHNAGDNFNGLTSAVQKFTGIDYRTMSKGLNWIVFNRHERGIRDSASQEQLSELTDLEKKMAFAVDMGYIRTFDELVNEMRRMYHKKWD